MSRHRPDFEDTDRRFYIEGLAAVGGDVWITGHHGDISSELELAIARPDGSLIRARAPLACPPDFDFPGELAVLEDAIWTFGSKGLMRIDRDTLETRVVPLPDEVRELVVLDGDLWSHVGSELHCFGPAGEVRRSVSIGDREFGLVATADRLWTVEGGLSGACRLRARDASGEVLDEFELADLVLLMKLDAEDWVMGYPRDADEAVLVRASAPSRHIPLAHESLDGVVPVDKNAYGCSLHGSATGEVAKIDAYDLESFELVASRHAPGHITRMTRGGDHVIGCLTIWNGDDWGYALAFMGGGRKLALDIVPIGL